MKKKISLILCAILSLGACERRPITTIQEDYHNDFYILSNKEFARKMAIPDKYGTITCILYVNREQHTSNMVCDNAGSGETPNVALEPAAIER